jgi:hypothetical protein
MIFPGMLSPLLARRNAPGYEAAEDQHELRQRQSAALGEE